MNQLKNLGLMTVLLTSSHLYAATPSCPAWDYAGCQKYSNNPGCGEAWAYARDTANSIIIARCKLNRITGVCFPSKTTKKCPNSTSAASKQRFKAPAPTLPQLKKPIRPRDQ